MAAVALDVLERRLGMCIRRIASRMIFARILIMLVVVRGEIRSTPYPLPCVVAVELGALTDIIYAVIQIAGMRMMPPSMTRLEVIQQGVRSRTLRAQCPSRRQVRPVHDPIPSWLPTPCLYQ